MRDTGMNFELFMGQAIEKLGVAVGLWSPCVFRNATTSVQAYIYRDNLVRTGMREVLY